MTQQKRAGLRELTEGERETLKKVGRSRTEAAEVVGRARSLLAVADGAGFGAGARAGGRTSGYGVGKLVERFNQAGVGLNALQTQPSHGHRVTYTAEHRALVLEEFRRMPDRDTDGTGTWSLTTLQRAIRKRPRMGKIGRDTISGILHEAGLTWQRDRTWRPPAAGWCETGVSVRKGKHGKHVVVDPDTEAKKN
jgi:transposase